MSPGVTTTPTLAGAKKGPKKGPKKALLAFTYLRTVLAELGNEWRDGQRKAKRAWLFRDYGSPETDLKRTGLFGGTG